MTVSQFISVLRARWWVLVAVMLLAVSGTLSVAMLMRPMFTAAASVVVDMKPDPVSAYGYGGLASPGYLATQVDILRSDRVARRVVRMLKLAENPEARNQWREETGGEGNIEDWFADSFKKNLEIVPSRESSVISVGYKAPNPKFAAGLANAFAQAYIDTTIELKTNPAQKYSTFFETRSKEAREALERSQSKLSEFQQSKGIIASDERLDVENARLNELSSQLTALQAVSAESSSRLAQAQGVQADRLQDVIGNPLISQLKSEVGRMEAQIQQLTTRFGDNHPQVIEIKANLAEMRDKVASETRRVAGGVGVTNTINQQRERDVRNSLEAQRAKVLRMKAVRDEGTVLLQEVQNAQRAYDTIVQRFTQTSLESQNNQSTVSILTEASPPLEPSSPRLIFASLMATFLGALSGLVIVFTLELLDRRVRSADDVAVVLGLPVIGFMPKAGTWKAKKQVGRAELRLLAGSSSAANAQ